MAVIAAALRMGNDSDASGQCADEMGANRLAQNTMILHFMNHCSKQRIQSGRKTATRQMARTTIVLAFGKMGGIATMNKLCRPPSQPCIKPQNQQ